MERNSHGLIDFNSWSLPDGYHGTEPVSGAEFICYEYYKTWYGTPIRLLKTIGDKDGVYADYIKPGRSCLERRVSSFKDLEDPNTIEITKQEYEKLCYEYLKLRQ